MKVKSSLPRSWRCSALHATDTGPERRSETVAIARKAKAATSEPENEYTPKIVEYQRGSSDISQSKAANVWVSPSGMRSGPLQRRSRAARSGSGASSCLRESRRNHRAIADQTTK